MVAGIVLLALAESKLPTHRLLGAGAMTILALGGWLEFARLTGISGKGPKAHPGLHILGLLSVLYFFVLAWLPAGPSAGLPGGQGIWVLGGLFGQVFLAFTLVVFREDFERVYVSLLEAIVGVALLGFLLSFLPRIYCEPSKGPVVWLVILGGVKGNDIAAYYVGKTLGRRHFSKISPKKTLEGCLGALVFSILYMIGADELLALLSYESLFSRSGGILFGMTISISSQVGDLSESLFKRVYRVKDSGSLLPEFGGILDMVDSLIFPAGLAWLALEVSHPGAGLRW
jgi:phosphatidate cytidylyltransferase